MKPKLSYTIWFSQRTGSTLLCKALESTNIAGNPQEWLYVGIDELVRRYTEGDPAESHDFLWSIGSTPNGVFGMKFGPYEPYFGALLRQLQQLPGSPQGDAPRPAIWEHAFPNHHHIFMTRRNKVRLAVSWWKAIQSEEWHRQTGSPASEADLSDAYSFEAISHLFNEAAMREAGIQEFYAEANIVPLTVVYEDFILDYAGTVRRILSYLGLDTVKTNIAPPHFTRLADATSEAWVQRFREECQQGWLNQGW